MLDPRVRSRTRFPVAVAPPRDRRGARRAGVRRRRVRERPRRASRRRPTCSARTASRTSRYVSFVEQDPAGGCASLELGGRARSCPRHVQVFTRRREHVHLAGTDADASFDVSRSRERDPETSRAARTARSASSSCSSGTPKTAMTASPMNFSTVPPWRSIGCADDVEVARDQSSVDLRVQLRGEPRRIDEVAEQDRDRAAVRPARSRRPRCSRRARRSC